MSATIYEVARLAGVSIKTVSRVVNGEAKVAPPTRERVLQAIKSLDYSPNISARALAGARSYLIGLYFDNPSLEYVSGVERGAMDACREAGFHLVVEELPGDRNPGEQVRRLLESISVDGVVLTPPVCDQLPVLEALDARKVPYVRLSPALQRERSDVVFVDDRAAAAEMTAYLQSLGHRRIGFIQGPEDHLAAIDRREGYVSAMAAAGLADCVQVELGAFSYRSGLEAAQRLLAAPQRPTAIFASNDDMALGVMAAAHRLQLEIPTELSVAGFDDSPSAKVVWPQLTTVRQPVREIGALAAELLIARSRRRDEPFQSRELAFQLIRRESAAAPRA